MHALIYTDRQGYLHVVDTVQEYGTRINSGQRLVHFTYVLASGVRCKTAAPIDALQVVT